MFSVQNPVISASMLQLTTTDLRGGIVDVGLIKPGASAPSPHDSKDWLDDSLMNLGQEMLHHQQQHIDGFQSVVLLRNLQGTSLWVGGPIFLFTSIQEADFFKEAFGPRTILFRTNFPVTVQLSVAWFALGYHIAGIFRGVKFL